MNIYDILDKLFIMTYDGQDLTDYFLVQEVRGRSVYSKEMGKRTLAGVDGAVITTESLPPRTLEVDAIVFGNGTETDLRQRIEYLNFLLHRDRDVPITFSDEPDRTYYGRFEFATEGEEKGGFHKITLNFFCQNPLKHGPDEMQAVSETDDGINLVKNADFSEGKTYWSGGGVSNGSVVEVYDLPEGGPNTKTAIYNNLAPGQYFTQFFDNPDQYRGKKGHISIWIKIQNSTSADTNGNTVYMRARTLSTQTFTYYQSWDAENRVNGDTNGWVKIGTDVDFSNLTEEIDQLYIAFNNDTFSASEIWITAFEFVLDETPDFSASSWKPYAVSSVTNSGLAPVNPKIKCIFNTTATEYEIQQLNDDFSIQRFLKVKYGFSSGDTLVIDCQERSVTLNGQDIMPALQIQSDWFKIKPQVETFVKASHPSTISFGKRYM